jgi:hypothetical protein
VQIRHCPLYIHGRASDVLVPDRWSIQIDTHIDLCIIRKRAKHLVEGLVHLRCITLEEPPATSDEQGISSEDRSLIAIFEEVADAILCMARCMQCLDFYLIANGKRRIVRRGIRNVCAVFAANYRKGVMLELDCVACQNLSRGQRTALHVLSPNCLQHDHDGLTQSVSSNVDMCWIRTGVC